MHSMRCSVSAFSSEAEISGPASTPRSTPVTAAPRTSLKGSICIIRQYYQPLALSSKIIAAPFSPIMMVGALVLPVVRVGMIEASMTRTPCNPMDAQPRIDDGGGVFAHLAGADRVMDWCRRSRA